MTDSHETYHDQPSDYEKLRARKIERNNQRLVELGLITEEEAKISNQRAWKKTDDGIDTRNDSCGVDDTPSRNTTRTAVGDISQSKRSKGSRDTVSRLTARSNMNNLSVGETKSNLDRGRKLATTSTPRFLMDNNDSTRKSARKTAKRPLELEGIWV